MTMEGENQESARFGSTVVNIGDINGDGTDGKNLNFIFTHNPPSFQLVLNHL